MTDVTVPPVPAKAIRVTLDLPNGAERIDAVLLEELRNQEDGSPLRGISRTALKNLFNEKKIMIKGQRAKSSSALAKGVTYVDIFLN